MNGKRDGMGESSLMSPDTVEKSSIPRPVWFIGWTSLFTDAANEVIYPLLPVYLSRVLGASAVSLGIIEGVADGINSLLKVISGYFSDRRDASQADRDRRLCAVSPSRGRSSR